MSARVIYPGDLIYALHGTLRCPNEAARARARERLREISMTHQDLTVAAVAAKLAKRVHVYTPNPYGGSAA